MGEHMSIDLGTHERSTKIRRRQTSGAFMVLGGGAYALDRCMFSRANSEAAEYLLPSPLHFRFISAAMAVCMCMNLSYDIHNIYFLIPVV